MRLIGNYLSPYVRRVAVSLNILEWSYPAVVRRYNPLVRIPGWCSMMAATSSRALPFSTRSIVSAGRNGV